MLERLSGITFVISIAILGLVSYFCANTILGTCATIVFMCAVVQAITSLAIPVVNETLNKFSFFSLFILTFLEEIIGRWLFVGILPQHLPGDAVFFILLISGNLIACWIHQHYTSNTHKSLELLPIILSGFFYSYIFYHYGFFASYLSHLAVNSVLLSADKIENQNKDRDFPIMFCSGGIYLASICLLDYIKTSNHSLFISVIKDYCSGNYVLEGFTFWDYFLASTAVIYGLKLLFNRLDQGCVTSNGDSEQLPTTKELIGSIIGLFVFVTAIVIGLCTFNIPIAGQALAIALFVSFLYNASSGSARVRNFWLTFASSFVILCGIKSMEGLVGPMKYHVWPLGSGEIELSYFVLVGLYLILHGLVQVPFLILERK